MIEQKLSRNAARTISQAINRIPQEIQQKVMLLVKESIRCYYEDCRLLNSTVTKPKDVQADQNLALAYVLFDIECLGREFCTGDDISDS